MGEVRLETRSSKSSITGAILVPAELGTLLQSIGRVKWDTSQYRRFWGNNFANAQRIWFIVDLLRAAAQRDHCEGNGIVILSNAHVDNWRTPAVVIACASAMLMLSLGTRQSFGLFLTPMTFDHGWTRETFGLAIALQNLVWGVGQPFAGAIADKFGALRVVVIGGLFYALGLLLMAYASTAIAFELSAGILVGLGLSGTGFGVVMGVVGRAAAPEKRSAALGLVGAGGSFGQFVMLPFGQTLISQFGWLNALLVLAATSLLIVPLAAAFARENIATHASNQSLSAAIHEAATHRGFWYLTASFLVCGFQTIFIMVNLPTYLVSKGLSPPKARFDSVSHRRARSGWPKTAWAIATERATR